jgi:RimK family alpha-L-glutamate ligase
MQVAILSARTGWHTDELCRALADRGHTGRLLPYEGLVARLGTGRGVAVGLSSDSAAIFDADAVFPRFIPTGSLEQIIYRMDALHWIENRGVRVMNSPRAIERSVDKFYTTALLQEAGLPTPETVVCEGTADAMAAMQAMGDVIVKPIFGSMGHGMVRVSDPDVAFRVVRTLEQMRAVFYVQRAVNHDGRDVRVFVVGGQVLGAIERRASDGGWRTNVSRGGSARAFELPPAWQQLAMRAAAAIGADYAGVDLLPSREGTVFVLEVNGIPGWQGFQRATGLDVAGALVEYLAVRVRAGGAPDGGVAGATGNRTSATGEVSGGPADATALKRAAELPP